MIFKRQDVFDGLPFLYVVDIKIEKNNNGV